MEAIKTSSMALEYADNSLKKDNEVVMASVSQNGYALTFADDSLKKDREVVMASVKTNGNALKEVDKVAYVRFASVYRDFQDIKDFSAEIHSLNKEKPKKKK